MIRLIYLLCCGACLIPRLTQAQLADSVKSRHTLQVLPLVARSIETGWSAGIVFPYTYHIKKADTSTRTSNLQALALYSLQQQFVTALNGVTYFPGEHYILNYLLSYSKFPDKFWGLGKYSPDSAEEPYTFKQFYIFLHGQKRIRNQLFLGAMYEYQQLIQITYTPGGLFDQQLVTGREGYHISGAGLSVTYDTRNHAFTPDRGLFIQGFFNHFNPLLQSNFRYTNYVVDLRGFWKLGLHPVLALQLFGFFNHGEVPLRSLATFGGSNSMRGFYDGRYRDKNQVVAQSEIRTRIKGRFGAVLFVSGGDLGHKFADFSLPDFRFSYGAGIRFALNKKEKLNLRLDFGMDSHSNRGMYFQLGEAF